MMHEWGEADDVCRICSITRVEYCYKFFPKCKGPKIFQQIEFDLTAVCKHNVNKYFWCGDCSKEKQDQLKEYTSPDKTNCVHSWKSYTGLSETFEYCEKCDQKK